MNHSETNQPQFKIVVTLPIDVPFAQVLQVSLLDHLNAGHAVISHSMPVVPQVQAPILAGPTPAVLASPVRKKAGRKSLASLAPSQWNTLPYKTDSTGRNVGGKVAITLPREARDALEHYADEQKKGLSSLVRQLIEAYLTEIRKCVEQGAQARCVNVFNGEPTTIQVTLTPEIGSGIYAAIPSVLTKGERETFSDGKQERVALKRILLAVLSDRATA